MKKIKSYSKDASRYDKLHADKCYFWEVKELKERIKESKKSKGRSLLDVGCGTGGHLKELQDDFDCTGIDYHEEMVELARKKLKKKVHLMQGDMVDFDLKKEFDVVICLYSVINHAKNYLEFRRTISNFYRHLKKGGVCFIEPYWTSKIYKNYSGKSKAKDIPLMNEIDKWSRIMEKEGFRVKYLYRGLHQSAKGLYVLFK